MAVLANSSPPTRPVAAVRALLLCAVLAACADERPVVLAWRPGDGLLQRLEQATVLQWPATNLSAEVLDCWSGWPEGEVLLRSPAIAVESWVGGEALAAESLPGDLDLGGRRPRLWRAPGVHRELGAIDPSSTSFWIGSRRLAEVAGLSAGIDSGSELPAVLVAWDDQLQTLVAVADEAPRGVCVVRPLPGASVFGGRELLLGSAGLERPEPTHLRQRLVLEGQTREGLLLPAPGRLCFPPATVVGESLQLAVRLLPRSQRPGLGGALHEAPSRSDGVVCALDVVVADPGTAVEALGRPADRQRIWSRALVVADGLLEVQVDLSPWRGRTVALQLVSEPGPASDQDDDWVQWSGLRFAGPPTLRPAHPHLVLIDVDTLRADALGPRGPGGGVAAGSSDTPRLDRWAAAHALMFDDVLSSASWTLPATATMLTGLAVQQHRLDHRSKVLAPQVEPLALRLSRAGYETRAFTEGGYVGPSFGFDRGFDTFETSSQGNLDWQAAASFVEQRRSERPFFLFLQSYMVHAPYPDDERFEDPSRPYAGPFAGQGVSYEEIIHPYEQGSLDLSAADQAYVRRMYRAGVSRMDEVVGGFIESLEEALAGQPFVLVLTSDHGEAFFEHGLIDHHKGLYDELLRVPLWLRLPGFAPGHSAEPASLVDLLPTLLDALDLPPAVGLPGRSLLADRGFAVPRVAQHSSSAHSLTLGHDKLILGSSWSGQDPQLTVQLFDLERDPGEHSNRAAQDPELAGRMERLLSDWLEAWPGPGAADAGGLDNAALGELSALGYLGDEGGRR